MTPLIIHAVERHEVKDSAEVLRRCKVLASWGALYGYSNADKPDFVVPAHYWEKDYRRTAKDIGDARALPYLKDVLTFALEKADCGRDIIMFTNDDVILHPDLPRALRRHLAIWECCSSHRCEFHYRQMPSLSAPASAFGEYRESHIGRDLFAFTADWLYSHLDEIPDFILGASDWDLCVAWLLRLKKGFPATQQNLADVLAPCELVPGYVIHEWHKAAWTLDVMKAPSQRHNRGLFMEWCKARGIVLTWDWAVAARNDQGPRTKTQ